MTDNDNTDEPSDRFLHALAQAWPDAAPPAGLALAGIQRVAQHLIAGDDADVDADTDAAPMRSVPSTLVPNRSPREWAFTRQHINAVVLSLLAILGVSLTMTFVQFMRKQAELLACQNNMRLIHGGLAQYSEQHDGQFPKAGSTAVPSAGDFVAELQRNGLTVSEASKFCPTTGRLELPVGYAYTLGYRSGGELNGVWKPITADDATPILADLPGLAAGAKSTAHGGWNVLYVSGAVRFTTQSRIGQDRDDIFLNAAGERRAGLSRYDTCLGLPADRP